MDSQLEDSHGYPTDTDAGPPMDDTGEELVEGPDGNFNVVELEVLAWRRRECTQVGKKEKPSIMWEICHEFGKMEKHRDLRLVEWQEKEEQIATWLKKLIRLRKPCITVRFAYKYSMQSVVQELHHHQIQLKHTHMKSEGGAQATQCINLYQQALSAFIQEDLTDEQWQGAQDIVDKWNGAEGPTPEVQAWNAKKYGLKYMWNFTEEMWWYCGMRIISLTGWKNEEGIIQAYCMDFNNDIGGSSNFNDIHTINTSWREYLGTAYENPNVAAGGEVPNMVANHPRAKMGDPVKVVTNDEGNIWIGDLNGQNCNSILQMVRGYLTVHYRKACGKWLSKVPFQKLGQYQANMISPHHLPQNFTFTIDPSHMHLSDAMELLNFWKECQESHPKDIFTFQKWLDQAGNLQLPSDRSTLPLQIAKKQTTQSWKAPITADESTDNQNDNTGTEDEATSTINVVPVSSRGKSYDEEQHEVISTEDEVVGNEALPVVKQPSTSRQPTIQHKGSRVTAELPDASGYMDDDEFDSVPFTDVCTTHSGPSGQHQKGGKLESALKGHSRCEQKDMNAQPNLKTRRNPQQSMAKATKRH
ncbi:hypothetical protein EDD16DRAFT_1719226 [Pisolithus croceorrhizus]|nr:hypothetical protein EDD16DRAFT_1719226 [Pisolithus croceorrhizus]KAI6161597.1 hypothetical protein EDD17DRAFT_1759030 [Pisolithus thermaeus]